MIYLVSTNDHPQPVEYHLGLGMEYSYPAESLQLNEQEEANAIAAFVGEHIVTLVAGLLIGAAITLLMVMEFSR